MSFTARLRSVIGGIVPWQSNAEVTKPIGSGVAGISKDSPIYKAVIPKFLYKPPYGYPRFVDIPELRRLSATPYVSMCVTTIIDEIAAIPWEIVPRDTLETPEGEESVEPVAHIKEVNDFLMNPNVNKENFNIILRRLLKDILELDSAVLIKVFNMMGDLKEIYAKDGGTFTLNPDIFGTFQNCAEIIPTWQLESMSDKDKQEYMDTKPAYFQYGWITGARPMPFGTREVIYFMRNPRTDNIYGRAPVEILLDTIQLLLYGQDMNLDYFTDNNIPKGVFRMEGAASEDIQAFKEQWQTATKVKNEVGDWRKRWWKMPVINTQGQFERIQFSNAELEIIQQQEWFTKLVWSVFGITPSELGFTESSNRACYTEDTRVMTKEGLKYYWEIKKEEEIMIVNPKTREIQWDVPIDLAEYDVENEEIITFYSPMGIDMAVTPEHKIWFSTSGNYDKAFKEGKAKDALEYKKVVFDNKAKWNGEEIKEVTVEGVEKHAYKDRGVNPVDYNADDFLEFLGWMISEGGISKTGLRSTIAQVDKVNADKIESVLKRLGLSYGRYIEKAKGNCQEIVRFNVHGKQINTWLKKNIGNYCYEKRIPTLLKNVSKRQLRILFDTLMLGDGTKDTRGFSNMTYYSNSIHLCEDVQEIAMKLGYNAHIGGDIERDRAFRVFITNKTTKSIRDKNISKIKYTGKVYSFQTKTGYYVTERNGKLSFQGNTELVQSRVFRRKAIRPILQLLEHHLNQELIWSEFYEDVEFKFVTEDLGEDLEKAELYEKQLKNGIRSINEVREIMQLPPVEDGDDHKGTGGEFNPFEQNNPFNPNTGTAPNEEENEEATNTEEEKPKKKESKSISIESLIKSQLRIQEKDILKLIKQTLPGKSKIAQIKEVFGDEFSTNKKEHYIRRWRGQNGEWRYEYRKPQINKPSKRGISEDKASKLFDMMFDGVGDGAGYPRKTEYQVGVGSTCEAAHCIFGSNMKEVMRHGEHTENAHISEELNIIKDNLEEYQRNIGKYKTKNDADMIKNSERVNKITKKIETELNNLSPKSDIELRNIKLAKLSNNLIKQMSESIIENPTEKPFIKLESTYNSMRELFKKEWNSKKSLKALDTSILKKILSLLSLESINEEVKSIIRISYLKGHERGENAVNQNIQYNRNAVTFIEDYTFDNVKDITTDTQNKLRQEIQRGIMSGEPYSKMAERIKGVFDVQENRAGMIARTEVNRAENTGMLQSIKTSGVKGKKEWIATLDSRTCPICRHLDGTQVDINENFEYKGLSTPITLAHVNCRCKMAFVPEE